jgi:hypothetical protein
MIKSCLLCGNDPDFLAVFRPTDQAAAGAPPGKTRAIAYALCARCWLLPDLTQRCEEKIRVELDLDDLERN